MSTTDTVPLREKKSYLSGAEPDHQVSDEGVLGLPGAMADHHTPAVALGHLASERKTGRPLTGLYAGRAPE